MKNRQNAIRQAWQDIAARVPGQARQNGDYIGDEDLLYCGVCHRPKQCWVDFMGTLRKMPVVCQCEKDRLAAEEAEKARVQFAKKVERLRADCFPRNDDGTSTIPPMRPLPMTSAATSAYPTPCAGMSTNGTRCRRKISGF